MSRQSEIRERLERLQERALDTDDTRYLLDRLEAAEVAMKFIEAHKDKALLGYVDHQEMRLAYSEGANRAFAQLAEVATDYLKESQ